ncbi:arf-GAP with dual PH domain-containing protein 2 isoform X2 [Hyperolius riggenbachi]|uniref:arf-GAP with dual PH domain-containing protein 2 isoform X2 n=1 Tax=Hyperolius riggenbachi TaxID=752182 RepID=UPI0035A37E8E
MTSPNRALHVGIPPMGVSLPGSTADQCWRGERTELSYRQSQGPADRMAGRSPKVLELLRLPENSRCADCGQPDPVWASCNIGVFVCLQCSGVHRIPSIGRVKSIQLDYLEHDVVEFLKRHGNQKARDEYEANVPPFYYRPNEKDCMVLKEQWIRAKYERKEFTAGKESIYAIDYKEGYLWKKGRDNAQFLRRLFVFSENEGVLKYYVGDKRSGARGRIPIQTLNAMFQVDKIQQTHGLEITCAQGGQTRSIYVYHEDGAEIVTWYNVLRYGRFQYLKRTFPQSPEAELIPKITRSYSKSGYMEKTGPTQREAFKKRWFNLDSEERKLLYYKRPLDPYEQGSLFIGSVKCGYQVTEGIPRGIKGSKWDAGITIATPNREFVFTCENSKEQREWLEALRSITSRPMSEQDTTEEARFRNSIVK